MKITGYCYVLKVSAPDNPITGFTDRVWTTAQRNDYHWYRVTVDVPDPFPIEDAEVVGVTALSSKATA